ncbi:AvrPphF family type III effector [Erwinia mallotivora]|uniref:Type III effector n=1 Tax=Erwinia mallotivora TaxID=69222 RepID=A0A014NBN5_9GAMM|nr:AvrPphF family type III effector [Erwinia mallotivora]EXU76793.1 type III effector [Erwinia mallotivora]
MGNVCGSSGSHHVYSPSSTPRYGSAQSSANSTPVRHSPAHSSAASSPSGERLTSVYQLSSKERKKFLNNHDPMKRFGLSSSTPVYRTTHKSYVDEDGMMAGNPHSGALIEMHEELAPNPFARSNGFRPDEARAYVPRKESAHNLGVPSLNVMVGAGALGSVKRYAQDDHVTTKMKLGDFLNRGGKVYTDYSAVAGNGDTTNALLVTLPEGEKVPVKIV